MPPKKKPRTSGFLDDSAFSDLTLKFGGESRRVHKVILDRKSKWFATALTSSFAEAKQHEITLEDDDPEILNAMLDFCYGDYPLGSDKRYKGSTPAAFRARLFEMADKYDIPTLKDEVEAWFDTNNLESTTKEDRYQALTIMYRMPDMVARELRCIALEQVRCQLNKMNTEEEFQDLITEQPQLAADVLRLLRGDVSACSYTEYQCVGCAKRFFIAPVMDETVGMQRGVPYYMYCPLDKMRITAVTPGPTPEPKYP
ncbi:hypothetical protein MBLNU457_g0012t1 [Dothideomycetes sp. NU457]